MDGEIIQVLGPLADNPGAGVALRYIDAGDRSQCRQEFLSFVFYASGQYGKHGGKYYLGFPNAETVKKRGQGHGVGDNTGPTGDNQGMALITVGGINGDTVGSENGCDIKVVQLIVDGKGQDGEV
jgi:hypothetical protein